MPVRSMGGEVLLEEGGHGKPIPVFLPGESHGQRIPAGHSPWGHKESDATEQAGTPFCTVLFERATVFQPSEWEVMLELSSKSFGIVSGKFVPSFISPYDKEYSILCQQMITFFVKYSLQKR